MSDFWPQDLLDAAHRNDLIIVVGAGVSMNSSNCTSSPPSWPKLLAALGGAAKLKDEESKELDSLITAGATLEAAELIRSRASAVSRLSEIQTLMQRLTDGGSRDPFPPNAWHEAVLMLEPQVIVTTNYDRLIERASKSAFHTHSYDSPTLGREIRRGEPVLIKIHGTVDNPQGMVLCQSDYTRLHLQGRHALDVLHSLFMTRVALFIGYSLGDPDIKLLLQNVMVSTHDSPSHYILTQSVSGFRKDLLRESFGVGVLEYPEGEHETGLQHLQDLGELVSANR